MNVEPWGVVNGDTLIERHARYIDAIDALKRDDIPDTATVEYLGVKA